MPSWDVSQFNSSIEKSQLQPIYFLYGDETFLVDKAVKDLVSLVFKNGGEDFNKDVCYGQDADVSQIRDTIELLPMMAQQRMVIFKEVQDVKESELEKLLPVIHRPVDSTVFVMTATKIDKRKKWAKELLDKAVVVEFKRPFDNQISNWVHYISSLYNLEISPEACTLLQEMAGGRLLDIDAEIRKLGQFIGTRKRIEEADVRQVVSTLKVDSIFDLTNAIGANDRSSALSHLANLLEHGQNEIGVVAMIARHVRILLAVREALAQGMTGQKLSAYVGISPYFLKEYAEQSRNWTESKLQNTLLALSATDFALKSSPVSSHIWLENFIVKTCG